MLIVTTVTMTARKSDDKSKFRSIEPNPIFLIFKSSPPSYFYYHHHHYHHHHHYYYYYYHYDTNKYL